MIMIESRFKRLSNTRINTCMRIHEITTIKPLKPLTPAQARINALKQQQTKAKTALNAERERQQQAKATERVQKAQQALTKARLP